jgi:hypothetical protein
MQKRTYTAAPTAWVLRTIALASLTVVLHSCATSGNDEPDRSPDPVVSSGRTWPVLAETPHLPIGMNLSELSYYGPFLLFTDAITASGDMMSVLN